MSNHEKPTKVNLKGQTTEAPEKQMAKAEQQELSDSDLDRVAGGATGGAGAGYQMTNAQVEAVVRGLGAFHIGAWGGQ